MAAKQTLLQRLMHGAPGVWTKIVASSEIVTAARHVVKIRQEIARKTDGIPRFDSALVTKLVEATHWRGEETERAVEMLRMAQIEIVALRAPLDKLERAVTKLDELEADEGKAAQEITRRAER